MLIQRFIFLLALLFPVIGYTFDVQVKLNGFSAGEEQKVYQAITLLKKVVTSDNFKKAVMNKSFNNEFTYKDNAGLSNEKIYQKIMEGRELVGNNTSNNGIMDLELVLYRDDNSKTIGYTYPHISQIYINQKYLDIFEPYQVANNLFHEWLHKIGFNHSVERTPEREHSVPYALGYLVKDMAKGIAQAF